MNKLKFVLPVVALCFVINGCGEAKANAPSRKLYYPGSGVICTGHPYYHSHGHYDFVCDDGRTVYNIQNAIVE